MSFDKKWKKACGDAKTNPNSIFDQMDAIQKFASARTPPARPEGSFTATQWAERYSLSMSAALRQIRKALKAGKILRHGAGAGSCYTVAPER